MRKVVFSRILKTTGWANTTTIAAGDMTEEIDKLRQGGDGHIVVWGGVSLCRGGAETSMCTLYLTGYGLSAHA